jgi:hypothetical protein
LDLIPITPLTFVRCQDRRYVGFIFFRRCVWLLILLDKRPTVLIQKAKEVVQDYPRYCKTNNIEDAFYFNIWLFIAAQAPPLGAEVVYAFSIHLYFHQRPHFHQGQGIRYGIWYPFSIFNTPYWLGLLVLICVLLVLIYGFFLK